MIGWILGVIVLVLDIFAAIDVLGSNKSIGAKILWLLVIFLFPVIGMIIYYVAGRD